MKKNKLIKIFIIIAILVSIQMPLIAVSTGVVNTDTVRVREEATTDSNIVKLVSIGDEITITGEEGNWYRVEVGDVTGYIRKDLLTVEEETTNVTTNEIDNNQETPVVNNTDSNEINNQTDDQNNENPDSNEEEGIETANQNNDKTISTIKNAGELSAGQKIQLEEEIKIKILPSASSCNIVKLQANTEVTVLEIINSWCRIEVGEYVGWVRIDQ